MPAYLLSIAGIAGRLKRMLEGKTSTVRFNTIKKTKQLYSASAKSRKMDKVPNIIIILLLQERTTVPATITQYQH